MYEPRVMDVPGFDTPLKEASLEEFMSALPIDHMAQKQLSDLRRLAMDGAKATSELLEALKKIRELEGQLALLTAQSVPNQWVSVSPGTEPVKPEGVFVKAMAGKLPCPHCNKLISTLPGPWARHMNFAHPQLMDQNSTPATPEPL